MNKLIRALAVFGLGAVLAGSVQAASDEEAIRERIKPVGEVCVEGQACGSAAATEAPAAATASRSGSEVYNAACAACHGTGAAGAPVLGNSEQWAPRVALGIETLVSNAINGVRAMPPRGACAACSDDEIKAAVEHIVNNSQ